MLLLDERSITLFRGLLKKYYEGIANIAPKYIAKREFGFGDFERKIRFRHWSFKNERELKEYLVKNAPPFVSSSSAVYERPSMRDPKAGMELKGYIGSGLVFDIDADDLELKCRLEHGGSWVCEKCFDAVKEEAQNLIDNFLMPDFGFDEKEINVNFSGNRGYHVHVNSERVFHLDPAARRQIANYVAGNDIDLQTFFPTLGKKGLRLEGPKPTDYGWGGKLANGVIGALNVGPGELMELGIDKRSANLLIKKRAEVIMGITTGNWDKINIPKKAEFWGRVLKGIAVGQSESIDKNVINDIYHLIRLPGTIHGDTGLIAKKIPSIKELDKFEPMDDAIAFKDGAIRVKSGKVPKFSMAGGSYGPFNDTDVELPTAVAMYLILKRVAVPIIA